MKVGILYGVLFDLDGATLTIGGIQTYIRRLLKVVHALGWEVAVFQLGLRDFVAELDGVRVVGKSGVDPNSSPTKIGNHLAAAAEEWIGNGEGMLLFSTDTLVVQTRLESVAIQHGVYWDLPARRAEQLHYSSSIIKRIGRQLAHSDSVRESRINTFRRACLRAHAQFSRNSKYNLIRNLVCVDFNYLNVLKANGGGRQDLAQRIWIIPNHAMIRDVPSRISSAKSTISILFARRFVWYRGTRLISRVLTRILDSFPAVKITFAGDGPDEQWLRNYFRMSDRVEFRSYSSDDAIAIALEHDIALVPSLGSEGTSLSALEAMAARCVVVGTCVGGLTNVIINNFNGKLVLPTEEDLYRAVAELCSDSALRARLSDAGYETVKLGFSYEHWHQQWTEVLEAISGGASPAK